MKVFSEERRREESKRRASFFQTPAAPENSRRHATSISQRLSSSTPYPPAGILAAGRGRGSAARASLLLFADSPFLLCSVWRARCCLLCGGVSLETATRSDGGWSNTREVFQFFFCVLMSGRARSAPSRSSARRARARSTLGAKAAPPDGFSGLIKCGRPHAALTTSTPTLVRQQRLAPVHNNNNRSTKEAGGERQTFDTVFFFVLDPKRLIACVSVSLNNRTAGDAMEDQAAAPVKVSVLRFVWSSLAAFVLSLPLSLDLSSQTPHQTKQTFNIVPPGPASKHRKFIAARFPSVRHKRQR